MNFNFLNRRRIAPRILFLCYIFIYFFIKVTSIRTIPHSKLSFVKSNYLYKCQRPSRILNYNIIVKPEQIQDYFILNSSLKNNSYDNLTNLNNQNSLFSKFWTYIKSYFIKKLPTIKSHKSFNRINNEPKSENYIKHTQINPLSFFDFFDKPYNTGNEYLIKNEFDKTMSKDSPYLDLVRSGPSGIIKTFLKVAPSMVKDAISLTVSTLIGSFYKYSAETTIITTTDRLASLILNLQVTGYIYCNAEQRYRLASLYGPKDDKQNLDSDSEESSFDKMALGEQTGSVPLGDELLSYVKRLPRSYINSIFDNMNPEIVNAMRLSTEKTIQLLTENVVNPSYMDLKDQSRLIIQQTGSFAMQLCFWKLALGYCMRDQETKIELNKSLNSH